MPRKADYPELTQAAADWRWQPPANCLQDRVVLVTGAGDGIGRTVARTFAAFGANVVLLGRTRKKLEAVFDLISDNTDTEPVIVPAELHGLTDDAAQALTDAIGDAFGHLDGIVHNASMLGTKAPIEHLSTDEWRRVIEINLTAPFVLTRALTPLLNAAEHASVVLTASSVGRKGRAYWGGYAVSKFGVEGLMQVLADEHESAGRIRVNSLNPGGTRTAMRRAAYPMENPEDVPPPEAHMDTYLYLMSDASLGVTGKAIDAREGIGAFL